MGARKCTHKRERVGSEIVPTSNLLVLRDGEIRPVLEAIGALVRPEGLSPFALAIRSSLLLFGNETTACGIQRGRAHGFVADSRRRRA